MVIHTFGDSHACNGWDGIPDLITHTLGPKLCFSIGRDGINIKDGYDVKNGDTVIFCFGEIDCRCHIHKHITRTNNYKQIIDDIVDNYFAKIRIAVDGFDDLKISIYNVVPPVQSFNTKNNPKYPFLGKDHQRKTYVLYFNEKLQEKCIEYNFLFFNIYDKYADNDGYLKKSLSDKMVHIRDGVYIREFIANKMNLLTLN
jgi:hypothetical protein